MDITKFVERFKIITFINNKKYKIMDPRVLALMIPIVGTVSLFTMIVFVRRYENIERMAMIERGMHPKDFKKKRDPYRTLRIACTAIGVGIGLFVGNLAFSDHDSEPIVLGFTIMMGGIGLFLAYIIQYGLQIKARKDGTDEKEETNDVSDDGFL